jgi:hypothetical protein
MIPEAFERPKKANAFLFHYVELCCRNRHVFKQFERIVSQSQSTRQIEPATRNFDMYQHASEPET